MDIIETIKNLLAMANHKNSNENEAKVAMLKARKLMADYNIALADIEDESGPKEEIVQEYQIYADGHTMTNWKLALAKIVAQNFRVKHFIQEPYVVFYGYKTDAECASQIFKFLADVGNRNAVKEYNKARKEGRATHGLMNTFLSGFVQGVADILEKQCLAIMVVTPQEVADRYAEMTKGWGHKRSSIRTRMDSALYGRGRSAGQSAANSRGIEG